MNGSAPYLSIVIPAFNEEARLPRTIPAIVEYMEATRRSCEIIVVDDGSRDGTAQVTEDLSTRYPAVRLLRLSPNRGKGAAVRAGIREAKGQWILFADADQSTPISELELLLSKLETEGYDMAIGSRAVRGAHIEASQGWHRQLAGKAFGLATKCLLLRGFADTQCGFKCMSAEVAETVFPKLTTDSAIFDIEMLAVASRERFKVAEVPVHWVHDPDTRIPYDLWRSIAIFGELLRIRRAQRIRWPVRRLG